MNIYKSFFDNYSKISWGSVLIFTILNSLLNGKVISLIETLTYFNLAGYLLIEKKITKNSAPYKEINRIYKMYLKKFSLLIKELNLTSPEEIYALCLYMLENNYFYNQKSLGYEIKDLPNLEGADILAGNGVCRNISKLLTDIYNESGYNSKTIAIKTPPISTNGLINLTSKLFPNHAVTIVLKTKVHIFDLTNNKVLTNPKTSFYHSLFMGYINSKELVKIKSMIEKSEDVIIPSEKIYQYRELIKIFFLENRYLYEKITAQLEKVKTINERILF